MQPPFLALLWKNSLAFLYYTILHPNTLFHVGPAKAAQPKLDKTDYSFEAPQHITLPSFREPVDARCHFCAFFLNSLSKRV